ncbi:OMP_b-brl domain-containing protein [Tenacibaculum sp. 190524A02b]|uniref:OMP_b-brl domain-containing protein n=1 Tax=Tenacibaculum vairaonense TaxID=3137860 RepID=A0ABP1F884_9FLAO
MKKLFFIFAVAFGISTNAQDGQFSLGANFGLPLGDTSNVYSYALTAEANYLFNVSDDFKIGPSVAFINYSGKTEGNSGFGDVQFLPVAAAARFNLSEEFALGADVGYGIGLNTGNKGGFYYRPLLSYEFADNIAVQASYNGITNDGNNMSNVGLGIVFKL